MNIVLSLLTNRMTRTAVKQFWQVIDRITDAGQCDYNEVVIKVIKQGLSIIVWNRCASDIPLIKGSKTERVL